MSEERFDRIEAQISELREMMQQRTIVNYSLITIAST